MEVLDENDHRPLGGELLEEVDPRAVEALVDGERVEPSRRLQAERHRQDLALAELGTNELLGIVLRAREMALQHFRERPVRDAATVGEAAAGVAGRRGRIMREELQEGIDEPCLADARLTQDRDEVRLTAFDCAPERGLKELELAVASDEHALQPCNPARPRQCERAHQRAAADTAGLAFGGNSCRVLELERALCSCCGALTDEDLTRLGRLLEPGGDVDGVAGHEGAALARAPDHDLARVRADANSQRRAKELGAATPDGERGVERTFGVVFLTGRCAEGGKHRVAHEFLERSACALDRLSRRVVVALEQCARPLRILFAELRRSDEVDEENRRQLPLGRRRRRRCRRMLRLQP